MILEHGKKPGEDHGFKLTIVVQTINTHIQRLSNLKQPPNRFAPPIPLSRLGAASNDLREADMDRDPDRHIYTVLRARNEGFEERDLSHHTVLCLLVYLSI